MSPNEYASFLEELVRAMVNHPNHVEVTASADNPNRYQLLVRAHAVDQGRLIGKMGVMAQSFQNILNAIASRHGVRIHVQMLEPIHPLQPGESRNVPFVVNHDPAHDAVIIALLNQAAALIFGVDACQVERIGNDISLKVNTPVDPFLEASLGKVFRSIGKHMGRILSIHVTRHESPAA